MLIVGGNQSAGGYDVDNSLRFDDGSSDYLNRTGTTATDGKKFTLSLWFKRANLGSNKELFCIYLNNTHRLFLRNNGDDFEFQVQSLSYSTTQQFRDVSAWYHFVISADSTQATASDRIKWYLNGELITALSSPGYPSLNNIFPHGQGNANYYIGNGEYNSSPYSLYWDGYISESIFIDGQALDPTSFGEFDSDSGVWKPIPYTGSYGTNGFFLEFQNSAALGTDSSGNGNTFTVNNLTSIDQTTDTPTNNFCTMNPLVRYTSNPTFTEGNLSFSGGGGVSFAGALGTIAMTQGKWFWECKILATLTNTLVGVQQVGLNLNTDEPQNITGGTTCFYNNDGGEMKTDGIATTADYGTFSASDIMGVAVNMDDKQMSIYKNGSAIISNFALSPSSTEVLPFFAMYSSGAIANFGNPPFTISSGNADANGYGNFEYAVPSGYYALCTKNLAEYG